MILKEFFYLLNSIDFTFASPKMDSPIKRIMEEIKYCHQALESKPLKKLSPHVFPQLALKKR